MGGPAGDVRARRARPPATGCCSRRCSRTPALYQRESEGADVVRKEMYDFEDKGGRRLALRPEGNGLGRAGRSSSTARRPVEGLVRHARLPLRERRRRAGTASTTRSGVEVLGADDPDVDVEVIALGWEFLDALGLRAGSTCSSTRWATPADRRRATSRCCGPGCRAARRPRRRGPRRVDTHPMRVLDSKRPPTRAVTGRRAAASPTTCPTRAGPTSTRCRRARGHGHPVRVRAPARARVRLLHPHHVRVRVRARSTTRRRRCSAVAATTAWSRRSAGRRRRASGSAPGIERVLLDLRRRGRVPGARTPRRRVRGRRGRGQREAPALDRPSCGAAGLRADRAFDGSRHAGADEGGRPVGRARWR